MTGRPSGMRQSDCHNRYRCRHRLQDYHRERRGIGRMRRQCRLRRHHPDFD